MEGTDTIQAIAGSRSPQAATSPARNMVFVVGPSRAGKTTLLRAVLAEFRGLVLLDLDAEENRCVPSMMAAGADLGGWEGRWRRSLELVRAAETSPSSSVVVDVGAGSLQTVDGRLFFVNHGSSAIAVVAPWQVVLLRHHQRDPQEFRLTEYSDERQAVYRAARFYVDSSRTLDESVASFRSALRGLLGGAA